MCPYHSNSQTINIWLRKEKGKLNSKPGCNTTSSEWSSLSVLSGCYFFTTYWASINLLSIKDTKHSLCPWGAYTENYTSMPLTWSTVGTMKKELSQCSYLLNRNLHFILSENLWLYSATSNFFLSPFVLD